MCLLVQLLLLLPLVWEEIHSSGCTQTKTAKNYKYFSKKYKIYTREVSGSFWAKLKLFLVALYLPEPEMAETAVMGLLF